MKNRENFNRGCYVITKMMERIVKVSAGVLFSACGVGLMVAGIWDLSEKRGKVTRKVNNNK